MSETDSLWERTSEEGDGMKCPECKTNGYKEARQCPKRGGEPVCEACCKRCVYRREGGNPCRYYIDSPEAKQRGEIETQKRRALFLKKTADRLWSRGMNYAASQKEAEWRMALGDVKKMEDDLNERD